MSKFPGLVSIPDWRELTDGRLYVWLVDDKEYDFGIVPCSFDLVEIGSNVKDLKRIFKKNKRKWQSLNK